MESTPEFVPIDQYRKFIYDNKDALLLLSRKVRSIDTVRGADSLAEVIGRRHAIEIVDGWLKDMWGITTEDLPPVEVEGEELFKRY